MRYIDPDILKKANQWLTPFFDAETHTIIQELIAYDSETLKILSTRVWSLERRNARYYGCW